MTSLVMTQISDSSTIFQASERDVFRQSKSDTTVSNGATRLFPLTATSCVLLDQFIPVPEPSASFLEMEHYNSHGEIIQYPSDDTSYICLSPNPYPFPLVYPSPPSLPSILLPDQIAVPIRICDGPDCSTTLPPNHKGDLCRKCRGATAEPPSPPSSTPTPLVSTPASSSNSTPLTTHASIPSISTTNTQITGKKRPRPGPRCKIKPRIATTAVPEPSTTTPLSKKWRVPRHEFLPPHLARSSPTRPRPSIPHSPHRIPRSHPNLNMSIDKNLTLPMTTPAITTTTAPRPCMTTSCAGAIPVGSSTLTRHCPACVKGDWNARKFGIQRYLKVARRVGEPIPKPGLEPGRSRSHSSASTNSTGSLLSLSSLTSLDEEGDVDLPSPVPRPHTKLILRFPSALFHKAKSFRYCSDPHCSRKLDEWYTLVRCVACRARERQRREDLARQLSVLRGREGEGEVANDRDEEKEEAEGVGREEEALNTVPGARLCHVRSCTHIIPSREEYKSNMCLGCRRFFSSKRGINARECRSGNAAGVKLAQGKKRCASFDCGIVVVDNSGSGSLCVQCTKRKAREMERVERVRARKKAGVDDDDLHLVSCNGIPTQLSMSLIPKAPRDIPHREHHAMYPEYDCLHSLSIHFKTQLYAFLRERVSLALRQKPSLPSATTSASDHTSNPPPVTTSAAPNPPLFSFSGQFSIVSATPDITHPTHKPTILQHITHVRTELERASRLRLQPENPRDPFVAFKQGFAMRFTCAHSIPVALFAPEVPPLLAQDKDDDNERKERTTMEGAVDDIRKDIKGELDVITVSDDSHGAVPGQMTVVRFHMGVVDVV